MPTGRRSMLAALFFSTLPLIAGIVAWQKFASPLLNSKTSASNSADLTLNAAPVSALTPPVSEKAATAATTPGAARVMNQLATPGELAADSLEEMRKRARNSNVHRVKEESDTGEYLNPIPRNFMPGGHMFVDVFAFTGHGVRGTFNAEAIVDGGGVIDVNGWAIDTVQKNCGSAVQLVFVSKDTIQVIDTDREREERVDIINAFNGEGYRYAGYNAHIPVDAFKPGSYRMFVRLPCMENAGCMQWDSNRTLTILPKSKKEEEF